jgi:hypothetical protein
MTKKEINKMTIKQFIETVNKRYKVISDFEDDEGGRMSFSIDMNGVEVWFEFHRSYLDVYTYLHKGDPMYNEAFDLECELQETLKFISVSIEEHCE